LGFEQGTSTVLYPLVSFDFAFDFDLLFFFLTNDLGAFPFDFFDVSLLSSLNTYERTVAEFLCVVFLELGSPNEPS